MPKRSAGWESNIYKVRDRLFGAAELTRWYDFHCQEQNDFLGFLLFLLLNQAPEKDPLCRALSPQVAMLPVAAGAGFRLSIVGGISD